MRRGRGLDQVLHLDAPGLVREILGAGAEDAGPIAGLAVLRLQCALWDLIEARGLLGQSIDLDGLLAEIVPLHEVEAAIAVGSLEEAIGAVLGAAR